MFPTVELSFTYYQMPTAGQLEGMMEKAGPSLIAYFKDVPSAVEFRNAEWINTRVIEGLRKRGIDDSRVLYTADREGPEPIERRLDFEEDVIDFEVTRGHRYIWQKTPR
jgi:uncharacterized protein YecE (DUF72 family)